MRSTPPLVRCPVAPGRASHSPQTGRPHHAYRGHGGLVVASLNHWQPAASAGATAHALAASAKPASAERFDMLDGPVETARAPATEMHAFGEERDHDRRPGSVLLP
jgi:hypothetical protein